MRMPLGFEEANNNERASALEERCLLIKLRSVFIVVVVAVAKVVALDKPLTLIITLRVRIITR